MPSDTFPCVRYPQRGVRFVLRDADDLCVYHEVFNLDDYRLLGRSFDEGDVILDIGGHIGTFAIRAKLLHPQARVVSYESNPDNFEALTRQVIRNGLDVEIVHSAIWSHDRGVSSLFHGASGEVRDIGNPGTPTMADPKFFVGAPLVPSARLDEVVASLGHVSFLKIDIEGAEVPILLGASADTMRSIDSIAGEFHGLVPEWGGWVRWLGGFFDLEILSHPYPLQEYGGMFFGQRKAQPAKRSLGGSAPRN